MYKTCQSIKKYALNSIKGRNQEVFIDDYSMESKINLKLEDLY